MEKVIRTANNIHYLKDNMIKVYTTNNGMYEHKISYEYENYLIRNISKHNQDDNIILDYTTRTMENGTRIIFYENKNRTGTIDYCGSSEIKNVAMLHNNIMMAIHDNAICWFKDEKTKSLDISNMFDNIICSNIEQFSNGDVCISINNLIILIESSYFEMKEIIEKIKFPRICDCHNILSLMKIRDNVVIYSTAGHSVKIYDLKKKQVLTAIEVCSVWKNIFKINSVKIGTIDDENGVIESMDILQNIAMISNYTDVSFIYEKN